jgi:hypothetical protein
MSEKPKYTPGPWIASGPLGKEQEARNKGWNRQDMPQWVSAEHTLHVYVAPCADGFVFKQNAANAALISAAPDMLVALEAAEASGAIGFGPLLDQVRAAIAKAKKEIL